ncbi:MAG: aldo/keto reductase [Candidatus Woesearchaeota archaeon]|jgi:diketogulonate reductase-like aldo/keto reductase
MSNICTISGKPISKIGIGSYGVGGRGHRDMPITDKLDNQTHIDALVHSLKKGINFLEISIGYSHGESLNLFKQALDKSTIERQDIFITHSLYPRDLPSFDVILEDITKFYDVMNTTYADSTLVTQSLILKFGETPIYNLLHNLLDERKTRYVSLSNASPNSILKFKDEFGSQFVAHEGHLSFEVRSLQDKGVFDLCNNIDVENIIWRPLRKNKTANHNWQILSNLSLKYKKTQNQIILNWMCYQGHHPMVMSNNINHINENIESTNFIMTQEDYALINNFRPKTTHPLKIDWEGAGIDLDIVTFANDIEQYLDTNQKI